jgi:hypothetical protein
MPRGVSRHRKYNNLIYNAKCDPGAIRRVNPTGGGAVICDTAVICDGFFGKVTTAIRRFQVRHDDTAAMAGLIRLTIAAAGY